MAANPWWHPSNDDRRWDKPLPAVIRLSPDYDADLPLWGGDFGNIAWQYTKFPPELLDRLAAWQHEFDDNFHYDTGWRSTAARGHWANQANDLATALRAALGDRAQLVIDLWPLEEET